MVQLAPRPESSPAKNRYGRIKGCGIPESGVKTRISGFQRFQLVKLCEYVSGQVS